MIDLSPLTLIGGHYGSGKTEVAVNLAFWARKTGRDVTLADVDIVNPYFRSYEQRVPLEDAGIRVVTGALGGTADLPALPAELGRLFTADPAETAIIDLGGDPVGARVLARYHDQLDDVAFQFYLVLNANRPETGTADKALAMIAEIESLSRQHMTGIINNTHLLDDTTVEDVLKGDRLAREVAARSGIPFVLTTVLEHLVPVLENRVQVPVMPLTRRMLKPWESNKSEGEFEWLHE